MGFLKGGRRNGNPKCLKTNGNSNRGQGLGFRNAGDVRVNQLPNLVSQKDVIRKSVLSNRGKVGT